MGESEAVLTLALVGFAAWWLVVVVSAAWVGWPRAIVVAVVSGPTLLTAYWMRRLAWNAWFRSQTDDGVEAIEALLRRPDRRAE